MSDHKPLKYMFHKKSGDFPPRVEAMVIKLQAFDFNVVLKPGKWNITDYMPRRHGKRIGTSLNEESDLFVKSVVEVD